MIEQITNFFTIKMIYLWLNTAVLPFWISLIFFPSSSICKYLVKSIFPFFLLSLIYIYLIYFYFFLRSSESTSYLYGTRARIIRVYLNLSSLLRRTVVFCCFLAARGGRGRAASPCRVPTHPCKYEL